MHRTLAGLLSGVLLMLGLVAVSAGPAEAALGDNRCITKAEFRAIYKGMTMRRTFAIIDYRGKQTSYNDTYPPATQSREFAQCNDPDGFGFANIDYTRRHGIWRVTGKYALWD